MSIQSAHPRRFDAARRSASLRLLGALAVCALGVGCGAPLSGRYQGKCSLGEGTGAFTMPIDHDLVEAEDGRIEGFGSFKFNDFTFTGESLGRRSDEKVQIDVVGEAGGYTLTVRVIGEANEELTEIDGRCGFVDQGVPYEGDIALKLAEE